MLKVKNLIFFFISVLIFLASVIFVFADQIHELSNTASFGTDIPVGSASLTPALSDAPVPLDHIPTIIKSVYVTGWSAGSLKYNAYLQSLISGSQINAVVIDIKDSMGLVSYNSGSLNARQYGALGHQIQDINGLINNFHQKGIYVIGRIVLFEDPVLAQARPDLAVYDTQKTIDVKHPVVWKNNNGISWVDPASQEVLNYNIGIAADALKHGFDEINFDYVRFPTDGKESTMGFPFWDKKTPESTVIRNVFKNLRSGLPDARISVDIFGQTTTNTDDMGIGQLFEDAIAYVDFVCPMVYPSHYVSGFLGFDNPADHPYDIVKDALDNAVARKKVFDAVRAGLDAHPDASAKIRPWLQDFNIGAMYDHEKIQDEIRAVSDATGSDFVGFMLWNPLNRYTKEAVLADAP